MTGWTTRLGALAAAASAAAGIELAFAQAQPWVIGGTVSDSGVLAPLAVDYRKGLMLWEEQVNAAGGIQGRPVRLRLLDDASDAINVGKLYLRLVGEEKAVALIGPYGSAAALMASAEAETTRHVMVNGAAPSRAPYKRSPRYVFQAGIPYSAYGKGVLEIARSAGYARVLIVARGRRAPR